MSGVLKAGDQLGQAMVRALPVPLEVQPAERTPFQSADFAAGPGALHGFNANPDAVVEMPGRAEELDRHCMELEASIADLRHQLAEADDDARTREDAAYAKGRKDGVELSVGEEEKRATLLGATLDKLRQAHAERLAEYELLALQLARAALGRIFGDQQLQAELLGATLDNHLSKIRRELILKVRLSPQDFGEEATDAYNSGRFAGLTIERDASLSSGDCEIDLRLGKIDLGLPGQWQRLCDYFDQLAQEEQRA